MTRDTTIEAPREGSVLERYLETAQKQASLLSLVYGRLSNLSDRLIGAQPEAAALKDPGGSPKPVAYLDRLRDINEDNGVTIDAIMDKLNELDRLI